MSNHNAAGGQLIEYVTVMIGGQLFGLQISRVQDVFVPDRLTRGRIVTTIDMRRRLGLPPRDDNKPSMAVGIDLKGESYGLLIDTVGEVMKLGETTLEPNPVNLDPRLARVSGGVHRLDGQLMVILDVDYVLNGSAETLAA